MVATSAFLDAQNGGFLPSAHASQFGGVLATSLSYGGGALGPTELRVRSTAKAWKFRRDQLPPELQKRHDAVIAKCKDYVKRADQKRKRQDGKAWSESQWRTDSFSADSGLFMARQLEHVYADVLREPLPNLNGLDMFFVDNSVQPGKESHTVRRFQETGEAALYKGGNSKIPRVGLTQKEEAFPVRHLVSSFEVSLFDILAAGAADNFGISLVAELLRIARRAIMTLLNRKIWYGDDTAKLWGVLNYPWIMRKVMATSFVLGVGTGVDMLNELNALVNLPGNRSKDVLEPNRFATSKRMRQTIMQTVLQAGDPKTVGQQFIETNEFITNIDTAWELQGTGPGGTDVIVVYNDGRDGIAIVMVQAFQSLPVQLQAFQQITYCYASYGGVIMRNAGSNILGFAVAEA